MPALVAGPVAGQGFPSPLWTVLWVLKQETGSLTLEALLRPKVTLPGLAVPIRSRVAWQRMLMLAWADVKMNEWVNQCQWWKRSLGSFILVFTDEENEPLKRRTSLRLHS